MLSSSKVYDFDKEFRPFDISGAAQNQFDIGMNGSRRMSDIENDKNQESLIVFTPNKLSVEKDKFIEVLK